MGFFPDLLAGKPELLADPLGRKWYDMVQSGKGAEAAIHQTLQGFEDLRVAPPGDMLKSNKKTPFVWADQQS